jgi:hypothetical protein
MFGSSSSSPTPIASIGACLLFTYMMDVEREENRVLDCKKMALNQILLMIYSTQLPTLFFTLYN